MCEYSFLVGVLPGGICDVCLAEDVSSSEDGSLRPSALYGLLCKHEYCSICWLSYLGQQLEMGRATEIECMGDNCKLRAHEKFVLCILAGSPLKEKYNRFAFRDLVQVRYLPCKLGFVSTEYPVSYFLETI